MTKEYLIILVSSVAAGIVSIFLPKQFFKTSSSSRSDFRTDWIFYLGLIIFISGLLYWVNRSILQSFMNSGDEHSCYFLAECIKNFRLWAAPPEPYEFFEVVHIGNKGGKWFSVYPPGWPILLALGLALQVSDWVNPILTAFSVAIFFHIGKKLYGLKAAVLGTIFMISTPFFLLNGASYFSHAACFLMVAIFLFSYQKWTETRKVSWAFICSFAIGYGLLTRYLTMASIAAPFLLYEFYKILKRKVSPKDKDYLIFAIVLFFMVFLNFYFNFLITGNFLQAPNHYYHSWERLGFHDDHTFFHAIKFVYDRFFFLADWFAPALILIYLIGLFLIPSQSIFERLFRFGFFYPVIAYVFYYSWGGNQYGPRYYFEGFAFLTLFAGAAISTWSDSKIKVKQFLTGVLVISFVGNVYLSVKWSNFWYIASTQRKALYELAEKDAKKPALIFIRGFLGDHLVMSEEDAVRNHPDLNTSVIYAHDKREKNADLIAKFPGRSAYLGYYDREKKEARLETLYSTF